MYLGAHPIDGLLTFTCNTHDPATQESADADSAPTYRVYEAETSTPILTGTMALLDDANTVGQYSEEITLSAANGFELGKSYNIRISATVDGVTGATERYFQMAGDVYARLGAPAGASVSADIAQILSESVTLAQVAAATAKANEYQWELQRAVPTSRFIAMESASGAVITNPTLASGDWKISKDGGAFANLATLPDVEPDGTNQVRIQLSESELDAEWIVILGIDQTGTKEWRDVIITIKVIGATVKVVTDGSNAAGTFKISRFGLGTEAGDMLKPAYLKVLTGALAGQVQKVTAYNATTDFVTVSPAFTGTPADDVYMQVVNG